MIERLQEWFTEAELYSTTHNFNSLLDIIFEYISIKQVNGCVYQNEYCSIECPRLTETDDVINQLIPDTCELYGELQRNCGIQRIKRHDKCIEVNGI